MIICGARHYDMVMHGVLAQLKEDRLFEFEKVGKVEQGFIDQRGVFMDRTEAYQVAEAAGQLNVRREKTPGKGILFSEDLY